jgi:hypothetical protein
MCWGQKLRRAKKAQREEMKAAKRTKTVEIIPDFTIADVKYSNASKVKSKARAIMNLKQDNDKLEGYDEAFMKELISHHDKADQKMTDFDHFTVGIHPEYDNTRCFFVVKKDGTKEDFSMAKCISNMEEKARKEIEAKQSKE